MSEDRFRPGQKFTVTNPDHLLFEEEWTIDSISYPTITFSCWKRWCVDREYMLPTSTEIFSARVVKEGLSGYLLIDARHNWHFTGFWLKGDEISYLDQKMFKSQLNRLEEAG